MCEKPKSSFQYENHSLIFSVMILERIVLHVKNYRAEKTTPLKIIRVRQAGGKLGSMFSELNFKLIQTFQILFTAQIRLQKSTPYKNVFGKP